MKWHLQGVLIHWSIFSLVPKGKKEGEGERDCLWKLIFWRKLLRWCKAQGKFSDAFVIIIIAGCKTWHIYLSGGTVL